jgi:putative membrane protein
MTIVFHLLINTLAIFIAALVVPSVEVSGFFVALAVAVVLGTLNLFLKPVLFILTLPINIITLGLFTLVINTVLILITARLVPGFEVNSFWVAFLFSIVLFVVNAFILSLERKAK